MKNKIFLYLLFYLFFMNNIYSQMDCSVFSPRTYGDIPDADDYIPTINTPIQYLRVNVHFILKEYDTAGYPGNFTKSSDGNGDPYYTGYDYANDLINRANDRLSANSQMQMPPGNSTGVSPRQYRYVLNGVFFHEDNDYYTFNVGSTPPYSENSDDAVNLFLNHKDNADGGGFAYMSGSRTVVIKGTWEGYFADQSVALWVNAGILNHEIGHNLSLYHTMFTNGGTCNPTQEDYCSDTPLGQFIIDNFGFNPCCGWGGGANCTNNQMDYTGDDAITPLQLGRVHWTIENEMYRNKICFFYNNSEDITNFTDNKAYVASDVQIPTGYSILVDDYSGLFINSENFEINGEFEITLGSILNIIPKASCN
ncbi:MAG: zinc-dependent metalloprotease family protein [Bacteroidales bacterium]|nr:zinc-dependent metalloprotease family protein [Bacteroidales bacterium]